MFWRYNNSSTSELELILGKENVTLHDVLEIPGLISECRYGNGVLISFLIKPDIMDELVTLTILEPSRELDESTRFKYPNIACELLTCNAPALNERLASDVALLAKLCLFLDNEPPLNPLLASFFSKIMGVLIAKKTGQNWLSYQLTCLQVLDFLKTKENFITLLLNHLGTSAIMDLTLKLMTQVEGVEMRQNILNWLDSQQIIQSLVALLDPKIDSERHYNVAQLLCDFISSARYDQQNSTERNDPDPLLNSLESSETISLLLDHVFGGERVESSIVGGIQVLLALLDIQKNSIPEYDSQNIYNNSNHDDSGEMKEKQNIMKNITSAILKRLKEFHELLLNPPRKAPINTTLGLLDPPLGNTRLQVTKLMAAIILSNSTELIQELASLGTMEVLLDLFFKYQWNNFLHSQVEACITAALWIDSPDRQKETDPFKTLSKHLIVNCKLIDRVLDAWVDNDEQQAQGKGIRKGYMGHLINILNKIVDACNNTKLGQFLKETLPDVYDKLNNFKETTLSETNKTQETLLGGAHPNTSNDDSDDYGDIPFQQSGIQQQYAHYQTQELNSQFIETYGFNDNDFNDGEDALQTIDHRMGINFDLSEGDLVQQHELFKQVCAQSINSLGTSDELFVDRDRDSAFQKTQLDKSPTGRRNAYNSDSDEDISPTGLDSGTMDVDPWASPNPASEPPSVLVPSDPWGSVDKEDTSDNTGWADFSSVNFDNFERCFENRLVTGREKSSEKCHAEEQKEKDQQEQQQQQQQEQRQQPQQPPPLPPLVETDLKLENIETYSNVVEENDVKNISNESIETVAQVAKDSLEEVKLLEASGDQAKTDTCIVASVKEIPLLGATKDGDTVAVQTGSAEETSKTTAIDKTEPNKEGV